MRDPYFQNGKTRVAGWRRRFHEVIFESDTPEGKAFDFALIAAILLSLLVVVLESVSWIRSAYGPVLRAAEWFFTILFTVEYIFRLVTVGIPIRYATSFFGLIDLAAVAPTYLSLFLPGAHYLLAVRVVRLLRIFRILKLATYLREAEVLMRALQASRRKIIVFLFAVLTLVTVLGSLMYLVEGEEHGFNNIPVSIYWAVVTLTTVGYGDIAPQTALGKVLASFVMIMGYAIIAVPTGIVTAELTRNLPRPVSGQCCPQCSAEGHDSDAVFCRRCGAHL